MGLNSFYNSGADENLLKSLYGDSVHADQEELAKAMNKAGLVQKEVQVRGKNGQVFTRKQWVKASEEQSTQKPAGKMTQSEVTQSEVTQQKEIHKLVDYMQSHSDDYGYQGDVSYPKKFQKILDSSKAGTSYKFMYNNKNKGYYIYTKNDDGSWTKYAEYYEIKNNVVSKNKTTKKMHNYKNSKEVNQHIYYDAYNRKSDDIPSLSNTPKPEDKTTIKKDESKENQSSQQTTKGNTAYTYKNRTITSIPDGIKPPYHGNDTDIKKLSKDDAKKKTQSITSNVGKTDKERSDFMAKAKAQGVTWKENDHVGINWMRCCMAMNKHFENGGSFDNTNTQSSSNASKNANIKSAKYSKKTGKVLEDFGKSKQQFDSLEQFVGSDMFKQTKKLYARLEEIDHEAEHSLGSDDDIKEYKKEFNAIKKEFSSVRKLYEELCVKLPGGNWSKLPSGSPERSKAIDDYSTSKKLRDKAEKVLFPQYSEISYLGNGI